MTLCFGNDTFTNTDSEFGKMKQVYSNQRKC